MQYLVMLLLLFGEPTIGAPNDSRIINGEVAEKGQFPWMVAIYFSTSARASFCGGSLINDQWVLTAAHCAENAENFTIYLGCSSLTKLDPHRLIIKTTEYVLHPAYNPKEIIHDVALIKLPQPVEFNDYVKPIALADSYLGAEVPVIAAGWGKTSDASSSISEDLRFATLLTMSNTDCDNFFDSYISYVVLCAMGHQRNICAGDSGSPIVVYEEDGRPLHVGMACFVSDAGCESPHPSGYVRTGSYKTWIRTVVGPLP